MIRKYLMIALAAGAVMTAAAPAQAREGCGPSGHRGPGGYCRPNGPPPRVMRGPPRGPSVGVFYEGRGYWDGRRYWQRRERWHGGWRYR